MKFMKISKLKFSSPISTCDVHFVLNALVAVPTLCMPSLTFHCKFFISELYNSPVTPVGPVTVTDALLLSPLVFCDICSSSLSLLFESLDSIIISNFHYYFQEGRPTRYYNRRTGQEHRYHIYRRKARWRQERHK